MREEAKRAVATSEAMCARKRSERFFFACPLFSFPTAPVSKRFHSRPRPSSETFVLRALVLQRAQRKGDRLGPACEREDVGHRQTASTSGSAGMVYVPSANAPHQRRAQAYPETNCSAGGAFRPRAARAMWSRRSSDRPRQLRGRTRGLGRRHNV